MGVSGVGEPEASGREHRWARETVCVGVRVYPEGFDGAAAFAFEISLQTGECVRNGRKKRPKSLHASGWIGTFASHAGILP